VLCEKRAPKTRARKNVGTKAACASGGSGTVAAAKGGFVFHCSDATFAECRGRGLLGAKPYLLKKMQQHIGPNTAVWLYNFQSQTLFGPFVPSGSAAMHIYAEAWNGGFPAQLRVKKAKSFRSVSHCERLSQGPLSSAHLGRLLSGMTHQPFPGVSQQCALESVWRRPDAALPTSPPASAQPSTSVHPPAASSPSSDKSPVAADYIFHCNNNTLSECLRLGLVGATGQHLQKMRWSIDQSTSIWIFNTHSLEVHGPFAVRSLPESKIVSGAWGGRFPSQVRVVIPLSLPSSILLTKRPRRSTAS
jgi:hypothetical protein